MNIPEVQNILGSDIHEYSGCDKDVFTSFFLTGDGSKPLHQYVAELVDLDIPVLIYAGDNDFICNWLGNFAWTNQLDWKNGEEYKSQPLKSWSSKESSEFIGKVKNYGALTFLRVLMLAIWSHMINQKLH